MLEGHETLVTMLLRPPSFKKGGIANHPVGVRMVELPQGHIIEERRGGAGILATLVNEMISLNSDGYIRCERTPAEAMPRVGQVIVSNGTISAAIHETDAILMGVDALIQIESDCIELDCVLQLIEDVDIYRVLDLHPTARLDIEAPEENRSSKWWQDVGNQTNSWTKSSRLPTIEASVEAPEFIQAKAAAMVHRHVVGGTLLKPGCVYSNESDALFTLAANLKSHGRPLLVISRRTREELVVTYNLPTEDCLWLSQKESEGVQYVDIDAIKGTVYGFLEGNLRAVLLLDGLEYLANICGSKEVIEMVRELGDRMRFEDDCLLISCDKSAWSDSESAQLMRAAPYLDSQIIDTWNSDSESLHNHPLMAPPTEEELLRLEKYLEANTPQTFATEPEGTDNLENAVVEQKEVEEIPIEVIEEETIMAEVIEDDTVEDTSGTHPPKGPRIPQRIIRRKSKHSRVMDDRDTLVAGLAAATEGGIEGQMPSPDAFPKTAIGQGREGKLPVIPSLIPTDLRDVVRQESTKKSSQLPETKLGPKTIDSAAKKNSSLDNVISPVAARGIEVKRNISNRSQASSLPQRKIDIEKELRSWIHKEEEQT